MSCAPGPSRRAVLLGALGAPGLVTASTALTGCSATDGPILRDGVLPDRFGVDSARWRLALPRTGRPRGLVVALHGSGGGADDAFGLGFPDEVESSRMALVSVDGGRGYWHARRDGSDTGAMVREELIPLALDAAGLPASSPVTLLGWSMGGFGALLLATELGRARVSGVVAASAALWLRGSDTPARAYDGRADFDSHSIFNRIDRLRGIPVRLDCGTADPFIAANRELSRRLPAAEAHFTAGGHDDDFWSGNVRAEMAWAAAHS
ncbi:alpha/beta hydrolase-fold protein [Terracoccus sp. 273MFTsu3.1]|uniref:alpha/beta hydrolase-fold protein n=1 Tax=Terracoccus sp. 273MFTsu3.1 TaxID=1172188 RepID=UPI00036CE1CC|nr:alpha/beta hydrolase-fold protein [Terracoccus sp. 273MFTsu3.1]